ncbi:hypothetical protein [Halobacterium salinarum]|uniref:Uncharacterized protein n=1 Tax=Halobacterium salinarum (strain ATCC 33171 / DSM 3754 / JCM 8978 / NBRC 102687 / NCIMB 764 / 91-R6) TaxID=2597657 RepID=A0A4D6GTF3_HALS9|nr:hypothetical protein [Halobacterium salinarum]QCC44841.1 uncharacterized protein HBSAL_05880 [Halobacterium salinarum]TYO75578.1 hypothetical protein APQ99_01901 [Halobacterium salinarum DSM 3754]
MVDISFDADIDVDRREFLQGFAEEYEKKVEQGEIDCPTDGCDSEVFDAEIWLSNQNHLEGAAICKSCNKRIDLNIDDSQVHDAVGEIESELEDAFK